MRHEEIQRIYKDHYFISRRHMGSVKSLIGSVDVIVFFVNDSQSIWTERDKAKYKASQKAAMKYILWKARERGIPLQIRNAYVDATLRMVCTPDNYQDWTNAIIRKYGASDIFTYQHKHEFVKQCTEAPILFVLNKPFRSSALSVDWHARMYGELAIISSQCTEHTIAHELLHQFGAMDLYYPPEVKKLVDRMNYTSIMDSHSMHIDDLTAYLIGWSEEIDATTVQFLEKTKHLTREYMFEATRREYQNA